MERRAAVVIALIATVCMLCVSVADAGGPRSRAAGYCGPMGCPPQYACMPQPCAPMMCMPQPCAPPPVCMPQPVCMPRPCVPAPCGPPPCAPAMCAPMPCGPPPCDRENPLAKLCKGVVGLAVGIVALPFKVVDALFGGMDCPPKQCGPRYACAPPMCMPQPCAPVCGPPMMGLGFGSPAPYGFGHGGPGPRRMMRPFAEDNGAVELLASPSAGFFGNYW
jgi:hypothetical protein